MATPGGPVVEPGDRPLIAAPTLCTNVPAGQLTNSTFSFSEPVRVLPADTSVKLATGLVQIAKAVTLHRLAHPSASSWAVARATAPGSLW
jgi:hypothetical protein